MNKNFRSFSEMSKEDKTAVILLALFGVWNLILLIISFCWLLEKII